jgi:hypothetical protein
MNLTYIDLLREGGINFLTQILKKNSYETRLEDMPTCMRFYAVKENKTIGKEKTIYD